MFTASGRMNLYEGKGFNKAGVCDWLPLYYHAGMYRVPSCYVAVNWNTHIHTHTNTHTHIHPHILPHTHTHIHITNTCTHTNTHTCAHTYTHTHTNTR